MIGFLYGQKKSHSKVAVFLFIKVVGVIGFEPTTTCSQSRYATRLRYTPIIDESDIFKASYGICPLIL